MAQVINAPDEIGKRICKSDLVASSAVGRFKMFIIFMLLYDDSEHANDNNDNIIKNLKDV
ncbi:hypothetical protein GCM10027424_09210 [Psychrobacter pacificensis]|jgi:hypothetical protein|uniref:Uncharacterized protein n=2 Tax=Psychrobacter TaxID=497 RepID=A0ABQ5YX07_9GAMM|nr:hypothetical protein [Psychrobacter pocilloporae]BBI67133.1 hypothetical protein PKHYL_13240 [Psychrobacter sp. KH172YL61]GLR28375.1 hypothetical protein GCM10007915_06130 [Psychrobacter pacificensis]HBL97229.1 hypothetical protein [Psychrobacter sp.]HCI30413.1 hypothetical protein [Psychrobacter sp.]|tara:strand:- start:136 stop:315 length:180 start_codon:yes stop_codon:yes gene_type:complete